MKLISRRSCLAGNHSIDGVALATNQTISAMRARTHRSEGAKGSRGYTHWHTGILAFWHAGTQTRKRKTPLHCTQMQFVALRRLFIEFIYMPSQCQATSLA